MIVSTGYNVNMQKDFVKLNVEKYSEQYIYVYVQKKFLFFNKMCIIYHVEHQISISTKYLIISRIPNKKESEKFKNLLILL